ncbi:MAG: hypothetical protein IH948_06900, partial [Bacteroidetes bacterium]|nr:hypothetical protein [Bacteroidota bacterium]
MVLIFICIIAIGCSVKVRTQFGPGRYEFERIEELTFLDDIALDSVVEDRLKDIVKKA